MHEDCIRVQRVSNQAAEGGDMKCVYIYKCSLFQSPFLVYGIFGQFSVILIGFFLPRQISYCEYLAICQRLMQNLAGIFSPLSE